MKKFEHIVKVTTPSDDPHFFEGLEQVINDAVNDFLAPKYGGAPIATITMEPVNTNTYLEKAMLDSVRALHYEIHYSQGGEMTILGRSEPSVKINCNGGDIVSEHKGKDATDFMEWFCEGLWREW